MNIRLSIIDLLIAFWLFTFACLGALALCGMAKKEPLIFK